MAAIGIGAADAAFGLKQKLVEYPEERGYEVKDYGCYSEDPADYPDVAVEVAEAVARAEHDRAILCCGTGLGMSITANKARWCARPSATTSARRSARGSPTMPGYLRWGRG